jgi:hypothetical protein
LARGVFASTASTCRGVVSCLNPGLMAGTGEGIEGEVACEVDQGAGDGGDGDAPMGGGLDVPRSPRSHAGHVSLRRRGHLGHRRSPLEGSPEVTCGPPAQHRTVTAGPDCGEEGGLHAARPVPHPVDPRMHPLQRTGPHAVRDLIARDARREQLRASQHPMRPPRPLGEPRLYGGRLCGHWPH